MGVDKASFRQAAGSFASGVTVVTTAHEGHLHGMTATAFTSLSLEPTLVLVCIDARATSAAVIEAAGAFGVNVLSAEQEHLSRAFSTRGSQESHGLIGVDYRFGVLGVPMLQNVVTALECRCVSRHEGGDHVIFVGEVEEIDVEIDRKPLLYFRGSYHRLDGVTSKVG